MEHEHIQRRETVELGILVNGRNTLPDEDPSTSSLRDGVPIRLSG